MKYHIILPVWGNFYVSQFISLSLASQLSEGNLTALIPDGVDYNIYTNSEGIQQISASEQFHLLSRYCNVIFENIDDLLNNNTDHHTSVQHQCFIKAMKNAYSDNASLIFLLPNAIYAKNSFVSLKRMITEGKRVIYTLTPRLLQETFSHDLDAYLGDTDRTVISIESRELVKLAVDNIHPMAMQMCTDSGCERFERPYIFMNVPDSGFIARCFLLHPVFIRHVPLESCNSVPIDVNLVASMNIRDDEYTIISDSDEFMIFQLSEIQYHCNYPKKKKKLDLAYYVAYNKKYHHHNFHLIKKSIQIHHSSISEKWKQKEKQMDYIIEKIFWIYQHQFFCYIICGFAMISERVTLIQEFYLYFIRSSSLLIRSTGFRSYISWNSAIIKRIIKKTRIDGVTSLIRLVTSPGRWSEHEEYKEKIRRILNTYHITSPQQYRIDYLSMMQYVFQLPDPVLDIVISSQIEIRSVISIKGLYQRYNIDLPDDYSHDYYFLRKTEYGWTDSQVESHLLNHRDRR